MDSENTKWVFLKKGTCSRTLFYILNREFGHPKEIEEPAADPLAGGIMQQGYQCGLLWGATLAAGAESFRRCSGCGQAIGLTIKATQHILESFTNRTKSADCVDITNADFSSKLSMAKYLITGKFLSCFKLADKWAPEALQSAIEGLSHDPADFSQDSISCSSEVAKQMGATNEEAVMVAGFAGGLGLSGNACGALSAAIWMNSLKWSKQNPGKSPHSNSKAQKTLEVFLEATGYEFSCQDITGKRFETIEDHSEFIKTGGCRKLIQILAQS